MHNRASFFPGEESFVGTRYQGVTLGYKMTREQFKELLKDEIK